LRQKRGMSNRVFGDARTKGNILDGNQKTIEQSYSQYIIPIKHGQSSIYFQNR
jgi:hypothetical protein